MYCHTLMIFSILCVSSSLQGGRVVKLENGDHAITGRGCGILTPIRILNALPDNPEDFQCSIIPKRENLVKQSSEMIQGTTTVANTLTTTTTYNNNRRKSHVTQY